MTTGPELPRRSPRKLGRRAEDVEAVREGEDTAEEIEDPSRSSPSVEEREAVEDAIVCPEASAGPGAFQYPQFKDQEAARNFNTFLWSNVMNQVKLRSICKQLSLKISKATKKMLISRIMLYVLRKQQLPDGADMAKILSADVHTTFVQWARENKDKETNWTTPDPKQLLSVLSESEQDRWRAVLRARKQTALLEEIRGEGGETNERLVQTTLTAGVPPPFSLNEFARLCVILRDDERANAALQCAVGDELDRSKLDARVTRESYWTIVAQRFNSDGVDSREDFSGRVDGIDSNARPLSTRAPALLRKQYMDVRGAFTAALEKWKASGQNDPARFPNFLKYNDYSGDLSAEGKRLYILFTVCRSGTSNEAAVFLNQTVKTIDGAGMGYDEGAGSGGDLQERPAKRTKRESIEREVQLAMAKGVSQMGALSEARTKLINQQIQKTTVASNDGQNVLNKSSNMVKMMGVLEQAKGYAERASNESGGQFGSFNTLAKAIYDKISKNVDSLLREE